MSRLTFKLSLALVLASTSVASARRVSDDPPLGTPSNAPSVGSNVSPSSAPNSAPNVGSNVSPSSAPNSAPNSAPSIAPAELRIAPPVLDRAQVRAKLLENRRANIARFHAYRVAGGYPSNVFTDSLANIWRDQQGHFCAAATIIRASGAVDLVDRIAKQNNFFRIADVEQGPVMDWILTSGLTKEELVMIQKPFRPVTAQPELAPESIVTIDPELRAAETRRLAKLYRDIEAKLVKKQRANLELAVDRLMEAPDLAGKLLRS